MNSDKPSREQIEARITALLLGELPVAEAELLRWTISQDAELQKLHSRLLLTVGLVREIIAHPAEASTEKTVPRKLSDERRQKLLAHFKTPRPAPKELFWLKRIEMPHLVTALVLVALVGVIAAMLLPTLGSAKRKAQRVTMLSATLGEKSSGGTWAAETGAEQNQMLAVKRESAPPPAAPVQAAPPPTEIVLPRTEPPSAAGRVYSQRVVGYANLQANSSALAMTPSDSFTVGNVGTANGNTSGGSSGGGAGIFHNFPDDNGIVSSGGDSGGASAGSSQNNAFQQRASGTATMSTTTASSGLGGAGGFGGYGGGRGGAGGFGGGGGRGGGGAGGGLAASLGGGTSVLNKRTDQFGIAEPTPADTTLAWNDTGADRSRTQIQANDGWQGVALAGPVANSGTAAAPQNQGEEYRITAGEVEAGKKPFLSDVPVAGFAFDARPNTPAPVVTPPPASTPAETRIFYNFPGPENMAEATTSLPKSDGGTVVLNGANAYVGGSVVNAGTLALDDLQTINGRTTGKSDALNLGVAKQESSDQNVSEISTRNADPQQVAQVLQNIFQSGSSRRASSSSQTTSALQQRAQNNLTAMNGVPTTFGSTSQSSALQTRTQNRLGLPTAAQVENGNLVYYNSGQLNLNGSVEQNGAAGQATVTVDPVTHNLVVVADKATSQQIRRVAGELDVPANKPQGAFAAQFQTTNAIATLKAEFQTQESQIAAVQANVDRLRQEVNIVDTDPQSSGPSATLTQVQLQKYKSQQIEQEKDFMKMSVQLAELQSLQATNPLELRDVLPTMVTDGTLADLSTKLHQTEQSLTRLKTDYGASYPDVVRQQKLADELNRQIDARVNGVITGLSSQVNSLKTSLDTLNNTVQVAIQNDQQEAARGQPYWEKKRELGNLIEAHKLLQAKIAAENLDLGLPQAAAGTIPPPIPQPEIQTSNNAFSTFSLNVSDVSFKLAEASLQKGRMPDAASIRSEEFINAFDYRDPEAAAGQPIAFASERARYPFAHNRDLLRFSVKTAAAGRQAGRALNLVLLIDNSGSMERADRVEIIREALRVLATQLQPQDTVSVVTFARTARLWADGVSGYKAGETLDQVGGITPEGGTNLEEAMRLAYETARRHYLANGMNRVVLLTDGAANLGNVDPGALKQKVEANRKQGIALDCFGIGWEGFNDDLLEQLSSNGDGRYAFLNSPEDAANEFAAKLAGALQVAAADVKVQVEFNPQRVISYRQIGYAKHQLTKEQFRDNTVDAAEIAAQEAGNALYTIETKPDGSGPIATVRVRYKVPGTMDYQERSWEVPYTGNAVSLEQSSPAMRLAATASAFSEWLASSPFAQEVTPDELLKDLSGVPQIYGADPRPKQLEWMIRQAKSLSGK